jgi:hypothetical protein
LDRQQHPTYQYVTFPSLFLIPPNPPPPAFTNAFTARVGPPHPVELSRKNCQINLLLSYTPGYSLALISASQTGFGTLDTGVSGVLKSTYYISGQQAQTTSTLRIAGPFSGRYDKKDDVAMAVWSPCGEEVTLNVNSEVALTPLGTKAFGVLAAAREEVTVVEKFVLQWRKC